MGTRIQHRENLEDPEYGKRPLGTAKAPAGRAYMTRRRRGLRESVVSRPGHWSRCLRGVLWGALLPLAVVVADPLQPSEFSETSATSATSGPSSSNPQPLGNSIAVPGQEPFDFEKLLARDREVSFPPTAGQAALDRLRADALSPAIRAAALTTLGETETSSGRTLVERWMKSGSEEERCAAVFAWGKMGGFLGGEDPFLVDLLNDANLRVAESALFALYMHKPKPVLERLAFLVARPNEALFDAAEHILQWHERGTCTGPGPVAHYLNLRWQAGRTFGTVYGQLWSAHLVEQLAEDREFLDACVLPEASQMIDARVQDHLYELLLRFPHETRPALAMLSNMPELLDRLVEGGLWLPTTDDQRAALLQQTETQGTARFVPNMLSRMALHPDYTLRVAGWLVPRDDRFRQVIQDHLRSVDPVQRALAARSAGHAGLQYWVARLRDMSRDPHPAVQLEALIARVRSGDEKARGPLAGFFGEDRDQVTDGVRDRAMRLMRSASNDRVLDLALMIYAGLPAGYEKACIASILLQGGRSADSGLIREFLDRGIRLEYWHLEMLAALGDSPLEEDREFLERAFPQQGAFEVNAQLARSLLRHGSEDVIPLLKSAIWTGDWNRSTLAAIILKSQFGELRLMQWVERPPEGAQTQDLRRVGFIIGSLGGLDAVETLQRHLRVSSGSDRPALQGAVLGALSGRTY